MHNDCAVHIHVLVHEFKHTGREKEKFICIITDFSPNLYRKHFFNKSLIVTWKVFQINFDVEITLILIERIFPEDPVKPTIFYAFLQIVHLEFHHFIIYYRTQIFKSRLFHLFHIVFLEKTSLVIFERRARVLSSSLFGIFLK